MVLLCLCPALCVQWLVFENICNLAGIIISILIDLYKPPILQLFYFCAKQESHISSSLSHIFKPFIVAATPLPSLFLTILICISLEEASSTLCITYCNRFSLSWSLKNAATESHIPVPLFDHHTLILATFPSAMSLDSSFLCISLEVRIFF